jgi:hypothetical protein
MLVVVGDMNLRKFLLVVGYFCIITLIMCWYLAPKHSISTLQDEKEWSDTLQQEREERSIESGQDSFKRLTKIYGDASD